MLHNIAIQDDFPEDNSNDSPESLEQEAVLPTQNIIEEDDTEDDNDAKQIRDRDRKSVV